MLHAALLIAAGFLAAAMNGLAGGGSFVALPALIIAGLPSTIANATSTVALYPGSVASTWVYRRGVIPVCGLPLAVTAVTTLAGGLAGAILLLRTPSAAFDKVLPWLLLWATLMLTAGPRLGPMLRARLKAGRAAALVAQVGIGLYAGYFGGAAGLMMMAAWSLLDGSDIKRLNPTRTAMVTAANTAAVLFFAAAGAVNWPDGLLAGAGAIGGGSAGAWLGKRLPPGPVRATTIAVAAVTTLVFFVRGYG
jgi:uncharacterized membrane protein YfcA